MKRGLAFGLLITVLVLMSLITACTTQTTSTTTGTQSAKPATTSTQTAAPSETVKPAATTTTAEPATTTAAPITAPSPKWWGTLGTPKYGGTISLALSGVAGVNFDTYLIPGGENNTFYEYLFVKDWALDRKIWSFKLGYAPDKYWAGHLAESWEITDTQTITVTLRKGILWQNKSPTNGREFTAYDVQSHYDRLLGKGDYTAPAPMYAGQTAAWDRVTAKDNYTVIFHFKVPSSSYFQSITDNYSLNQIEAPEFAALSDQERGDWHNAVGTGPWVLTNFVPQSSFTFTGNPTYWCHDPRYPDNKLPYADGLSLIIIPDAGTQVAALRTGKIDRMAVGLSQYTTVMKTNPEMQSTGISVGNPLIAFRTDKIPFKDIRVRQALQMAIDCQAIAKGVYGGLADGLPGGMFPQQMTGVAFAYADWPQSLKNEYNYNPTRAKELLKEAGYPNGFDTSIVSPTKQQSYPNLLNFLQAVKSYFAEIGVNAEIQTMDNVTYEGFIRAMKDDQMNGWIPGAGTTLSPNYSLGTFYSKSVPVYCGVKDSNYDTLFEKYFNSTDPNETLATLTALDKYVLEQHWVLNAGADFNYAIWQPYLKGYSGESFDWGYGIITSRLWIDK